jgi:oligo-1,6-glucosidase
MLFSFEHVWQDQVAGATKFDLAPLHADLESLSWARDALARGVPEDEVLRSLAAKGRDNARTPMQWDPSEHAGFTTGTPWLPVNANHAVVNAEAEVADPDSVFHHYRRLIELRHADPVVVAGRFSLLLPDHPSVWAFTRTLDERVLLVLANLSGDAVRLAPGDVPALEGGEVLLPTHAPPYGLELRPWESRIHQL